MSAETHKTNTETGDLPSDESVVRRAGRFGIESARCDNCHVGLHETDGDYGEIDCGWWCNAKNEETEPDAVCRLWLPDFWLTPFADDVSGDTPEETERSMKAARNKYQAAIRSA